MRFVVMSLVQHVQQALDALSQAGLLRSPLTITGPIGPAIILEGKEVICLCSNNYLGFASHPLLVQAIKDGVDKEGAGAGSSRLVSGTLSVHRGAETHLANYLGMGDALLFSSGFSANVGIVSALLTQDDVVFSDSFNHASLIDGCRLNQATVHVYAHRDTADLERLLRLHRSKAREALVISETVFSMDGDVAPVKDIRALCDRYDAALMVDEAHALGVLGPEGRGICAAQSVKPDLLVATLGKSFGMSGAFVAAAPPIIRFLINRARSYIYSTAIPPYMASAVIVATDWVRAADDARRNVLRHADRLRGALRELGFSITDGESPIVPVLIRDPVLSMQLSTRLLERGVFVQGIRPPTVPQGTSRLRIAPMASHSDAQIEQAIAAFAEVRHLSPAGG